MKRKLLLFAAQGLQTLAHAVSRFPKPDFESGYQYPEVSYAIPHEHLWNVVDVVLLVVLLGVVAWAVYKNRTRVPIIITSVISIAYFGFFRGGCVCSIGSIQNVALAMVDENYHLPWVVLLFFLIPIIFAFFFGRVFCAGVCPFGVPAGIPIWLDISMKRFAEVHPAGGDEFTSVCLTPDELEKASEAIGWCDVCKGWEEQ